LQALSYYQLPNYAAIYANLKTIGDRAKVAETDAYDWEGGAVVSVHA